MMEFIFLILENIMEKKRKECRFMVFSIFPSLFSKPLILLQILWSENTDKIFDRSKLKASADDKFKVDQETKFVLDI